eukprot:351829-Chlamydomonas_euryale.AAC.5
MPVPPMAAAQLLGPQDDRDVRASQTARAHRAYNGLSLQPPGANRVAPSRGVSASASAEGVWSGGATAAGRCISVPACCCTARSLRAVVPH